MLHVRWAALTADLPALDMLMRLTCKETFRSAVHVCKRLSSGRSKIQFAFIFPFSHQRCWIGHLQKSGQIQICGVSTVSLLFHFKLHTFVLALWLSAADSNRVAAWQLFHSFVTVTRIILFEIKTQTAPSASNVTFWSDLEQKGVEWSYQLILASLFGMLI